MGFFNRYGFLNATENEDISENSVLFTVQDTILSELDGDKLTTEESLLYRNFILDSYTPEMVLSNNPNTAKLPFGEKDRELSHDQLTSYFAICEKTKTSFAEDHWFHSEKKLWCMNSKGEFQLRSILHPRDWIFYGFISGNLIAMGLFPLFCLITLWICGTHNKASNGKVKTDGELLTWIRDYAIRNKHSFVHKIIEHLFWVPTKILCNLLIRLRFGKKAWLGVFETYYMENHPNRIKAEKLHNNDKLWL